MANTSAQRWVVGIDLRGRSSGAAEFALWCAERSSSTSLIAVHAAEALPVVTPDFADLPSRLATDAYAELEDELGPRRDRFAELGVLETTAAEDGVIAAAEQHRATALVIGRRAPSQGREWVRLGRVARYLLKRLVAPVIVVPPDVTPATLPPGPILIACDLTETCASAVAFGRELATQLDREAVLCYARLPQARRVSYVPVDAWESLEGPLSRAAEESFGRWAEQHGAADLRRIVVPGDSVPEATADAVRETQALMVVCGSRQLSTAERLFVHSEASALAAHLPVPVAVVPPAPADD